MIVKASQFSHSMNWTGGCSQGKLGQSEPFSDILQLKTYKAKPQLLSSDGNEDSIAMSLTRWKSHTKVGDDEADGHREKHENGTSG